MSQADKFTEDEVKHVTPTSRGVTSKTAFVTHGVETANELVQRPLSDVGAGSVLYEI